MFYLIPAIILAILTGAAKAIQDTLSLSSVFDESRLSRFSSPFFDSKERTSGRKYKDGLKANGEKYPLSSTILVFTTDAWHFAQMLVSFFGTLALIFGVLALSQKYTVGLTMFYVAVSFWSLRGLVFELLIKFNFFLPKN